MPSHCVSALCVARIRSVCLRWPAGPSPPPAPPPVVSCHLPVQPLSWPAPAAPRVRRRRAARVVRHGAAAPPAPAAPPALQSSGCASCFAAPRPQLPRRSRSCAGRVCRWHSAVIAQLRNSRPRNFAAARAEGCAGVVVSPPCCLITVPLSYSLAAVVPPNIVAPLSQASESVSCPGGYSLLLHRCYTAAS
jgi:hypothetical protein